MWLVLFSFVDWRGWDDFRVEVEGFLGLVEYLCVFYPQTMLAWVHSGVWVVYVQLRNCIRVSETRSTILIILVFNYRLICHTQSLF